MKLYKILLRYCAPKGCVEVVAKYIIADNDEQILRQLDAIQSGLWTERSEQGDLCNIYDDNYEIIGEETYLEKMLRLRGEFFDEDASYEEAYYGVMHYGWEECKELCGDEAHTLLELGIAEDWRGK